MLLEGLIVSFVPALFLSIFLFEVENVWVNALPGFAEIPVSWVLLEFENNNYNYYKN